MAILEISHSGLRAFEKTNFAAAGFREREHLQQLLKTRIELISPETLVISEEFCQWDESRRRIELLGVDKRANLVVIELKRTEDGGHMELQVIRYAAMVSSMTFDSAVSVFQQYLDAEFGGGDARADLLDFLGWEEPDEDGFAQDVRIVLASAEFSKEITTTVLWLNDHGLDVRCVKVQPYKGDDKVFLHIAQMIPLPEAEEYQIQVRNKARLERISRARRVDPMYIDIAIGNETFDQLAPNEAVYRVVRHLYESGVKPQRIQEAVPWRKTLLFETDAHLSSDEFEQALTERYRRADGQPKKVFCFSDDDELLYAADKTYAVSRHIGRRRVERILQDLVKDFPEYEISFYMNPADGE